MDTPDSCLSNPDSTSGSDDDQDVYHTHPVASNAPQGYAFESVVAGIHLSDHSADSDIIDDGISSEDSSPVSSDHEDRERLHNVEWCQCGSCSVQTLGSVKECLCCKEIPAIAPRIQDQEQPQDLKCITHNPHFFTLCLDMEVLEVAMLSMADVKAETIVRPISSW